MKLKNFLWTTIIVVVVLLIVGIVAAAVFLDQIVKKGVESAGPQITGTSVSLDEVHISLLTGSAKIKGFVIGNPPEGFKSQQSISVGLAEVGVNPGSLLSEKLVIRKVEVRSPEITFEGNVFNGNNNLTKIRDHVNSISSQGGPAPTNAAVAKASSKKLEVDDFLISGAKVHVILTGTGGKEMTVSIPEIHLTGLGTGKDGITPTELTKVVMQSITTETIKAVANAATDLGGQGTELLKQTGQNATGVVNKLKGLFK